MRALAISIALTGWIMLAAAFNGCEAEDIVVLPDPPPGYERTDTGSGCRDTKTGEYVEPKNCDSLVH